MNDLTEAEAIGFLQERGYAVAATEVNTGMCIDVETETYIRNYIESARIYPLYEVVALLDNDKLTNNAIRSDIEALANSFPQVEGKPEQLLL